MITKAHIDKIERIAKRYFTGASACHDWSHVDRVRNLVLTIGKSEKANLEVLEIAALLHDIGRKKEFKCKGENEDGSKFCHAKEGEVEAQKILEGFDIDEKDKENILHCVGTHRFRGESVPQTLEAKILFDADKLDSIGAVGVARDFVFVGYFNTAMYTGKEKEHVASGKNYDFTKEGSGVLEYHKKLKHIKDRMQTKTGIEFAKERHDFMVAFFDRLQDEVNGDK